MKKTNASENRLEDELRPEYDLKSLRVRRVGPERLKRGSAYIQLTPDVAALFPDSDAVNEALRFLIRITENGKGDLELAKAGNS
jgi:hypothetical protein